MRADRLLTEILLLQGRGQLTAAQLADELEVSERTVYRDVEALQTAGVPVVALAGPGGGFSLYPTWRSDLTGLTGDELTTLSVAMIAGPLGDGAEQRRLRSALAKIAAAFPPSMRREVERLQRRIHIDPSSESEVMASIARALQQGDGIEFVAPGLLGTTVTRVGTPLGLVASERVWYLVWVPQGGTPRADRVDDLLGATHRPQPGDGPAEVDLAVFWREWKERNAGRGPGVKAQLRVDAALLPSVSRRFGPSLRVESEDPPVVWVGFGSIEEARGAVLAFGGAAEVLRPEALRRTVADFAEQAAAVYRAAEAPGQRE
jgi:predicted DNA-binding transcriptional regulator YafY